MTVQMRTFELGEREGLDAAPPAAK
jgi:hypothetical protein